MTDDPDFYAPLPKYIPGVRPPRRRLVARTALMIGAAALGLAGIVAVVVAVTGSGGGSAAAGSPASTPRSTSAAPVRHIGSTAVAAPPARAAVRPLIPGTYLVNRDIVAGRYRAQHSDPTCAWAVVHQNGAVEIKHASGRTITIAIVGTDRSLQVSGDCLFVRID